MCLLAGKALLSDLLSKLESVVYANRLKRYHMPKPPIFVIGHWRSGTSFLQSLLGAPPGYVYFNKYQTIFPDSFKTGYQLPHGKIFFCEVMERWRNPRF